MRTLADLTTLPSQEVLAEVVAGHPFFKQAGALFESRPPDEATGLALVEAFAEGRAPPWLTAYLSGCLRARSTYALVLGILESDARQLAQSYAGVALARIAGPESRSDLLQVVRDAIGRRSREGALYGLGELGDLSILPTILEAVLEHRIGESTAGSVVAKLGVPHAQLVEWLQSRSDVHRSVALEAAFSLSARPGGWSDVALAQAVRAALDTGTIRVAPRVRRRLEDRVDQLVGAR